MYSLGRRKIVENQFLKRFADKRYFPNFPNSWTVISIFIKSDEQPKFQSFSCQKFKRQSLELQKIEGDKL